MNTAYLHVANLKATFGGWVLYRDGELFASHFESKKEAVRWAKDFCDRNGLTACWSK